MLESKKARAILATLMDFVPVELPPVGISVPWNAQKLLDGVRGIVFACVFPNLISYHLIQACAACVRFTAGFLDESILDCERKVHGHSLSVHGLRVNLCARRQCEAVPAATFSVLPPSTWKLQGM
jgi:hypothetical protein